MSNEKKKKKGLSEGKKIPKKRQTSKPDDIPLGAERNVGEYKEKKKIINTKFSIILHATGSINYLFSVLELKQLETYGF